MLVIERFLGEKVVIDGPCTVTIHRIKGSRRVHLAIEAEPDVRILRGELIREERANERD